MDRLDFSDKKYLEVLKAQEEKYGNGDRCELTPEDAFLLLIKELPREDLDNLCAQVQLCFRKKDISIDLTIEECYQLLQGKDVGPIKVDQRLKKDILEQAYKVADSGKYMGNKTIADGKINTSSWISHSLYVARFAEVTACELRDKQNLDINPEGIKAAAILHDYGRKQDHTLGHVTKGAESLIDQGYPNAAIATVTHSFFGGKRCASNEPASPGFYMDEKGQECWEEGAPKDNIREYLENHKVTIGDLILNLGDLVATDRGVVKLSERLKDIATRRKIDPTNREYFLLQVINGMTYTLAQVKAEPSEEIINKMPKVGDGVKKAEEVIDRLSTNLYEYYEKAWQEQQNEKTERINSNDENI